MGPELSPEASAASYVSLGEVNSGQIYHTHE